MRVWIETKGVTFIGSVVKVTLYVRVWIETVHTVMVEQHDHVTLYVRVWIETDSGLPSAVKKSSVTLYVRVWIETYSQNNTMQGAQPSPST